MYLSHIADRSPSSFGRTDKLSSGTVGVDSSVEIVFGEDIGDEVRGEDGGEVNGEVGGEVSGENDGVVGVRRDPALDTSS